MAKLFDRIKQHFIDAHGPQHGRRIGTSLRKGHVLVSPPDNQQKLICCFKVAETDPNGMCQISCLNLDVDSLLTHAKLMSMMQAGAVVAVVCGVGWSAAAGRSSRSRVRS